MRSIWGQYGVHMGQHGAIWGCYGVTWGDMGLIWGAMGSVRGAMGWMWVSVRSLWIPMLFPDLPAGGALGPFGGSAADVITGRKRPCVAPEGRGCGEGAGPHWVVFAPGGGAYGEWVWPEGVGETLLDGVYLWGRGLWEGAGLNRGGGASLGGVCPWGRGLTGGVGLQTGGVCPHLATSWPPVGHQFNPLATSWPPVQPIGHQSLPSAPLGSQVVGGAKRAGVAIRPEVGVSPQSPAPPLPAALPLPLLRPHHRHGAEATPLTQRRTWIGCG